MLLIHSDDLDCVSCIAAAVMASVYDSIGPFSNLMLELVFFAEGVQVVLIFLFVFIRKSPK